MFPLLFTLMATALSKPHGGRVPALLFLASLPQSTHLSCLPPPLSTHSTHYHFQTNMVTCLPAMMAGSTQAVHRLRPVGVTGVNNSNKHPLDKYIWNMMDLNKTRQVSLLIPGILQCADTEMEIVFSFAKCIDRRSFPHRASPRASFPAHRPAE